MKIVFLSLVCLLSACAQVKEWPASIPSETYFVNYYQQDTSNQEVLSKEDYLMWVQRFYVGWELYHGGWVKITQNFVDTIDDQQAKDQALSKLAEIGRLVSAEWAKHQNYRAINTRHLSIWGMALSESALREDQLNQLNRMQHDVEALLAGSMQPDDIKEDQYYPVEKVDNDMFD